MTRRQRQALEMLGVKIEKYHVDVTPPVWGIALSVEGHEFAVVETHGQNSDVNRGKYVLRDRRAREGKSYTWEGFKGEEVTSYEADLAEDKIVCRTQREAVAAAIDTWVNREVVA